MEAIGLALRAAIVAHIGKQPRLQERHRLEVFIRGREAVFAQKEGARLLDDILQLDEARRILIESGFEGAHRLRDGAAALPRHPRRLGRTEEISGEQGEDEGEGLFPGGLGAQETSRDLGLTTPLAAPVR